VNRVSRVSVQISLALGAIVVLAPFALMVTASLTPPREADGTELIPGTITLQNYVTVLRDVPIFHYYLNGLIVTITIFAGQVIVSVPAAYALARLRFRGNRLLMWVILLGLMIPYQVTAVPIYLAIVKVGLANSLLALIVPFIGSAFGIFLLRQYMLTIPQSVFDAARLDGAGTFSVLTHVVLPLTRPAILAFGIFSVVGHWNDYFWPSFVLQSTTHATVPFGIVQFISQQAGSQYGPQMAAAVLAVLPLLAGFLLVHKKFVSGISLTRGKRT
jgi:multiple sugar transport system permease protein